MDESGAAMSSLRFLEIAKEPAHVCLRHGCLTVQRDATPEVSIPTFELSAVVLAHPQCTITQPAIAALMAAGVPLLVCDTSFLPSGLMLPLQANSLHTQRIRAQIDAGLPLKKRLWAEVVKAKIRAQASTLLGLHDEDGGLAALAKTVRSGDPKNVEAYAAQRYWPLLFRDPEFRRRFESPDQNALLNYGYSIFRAAIARAVCASGLHPAIGLHHRARGNSFCLADDLVEPYRPLVDAEVAQITGEYGREAPLDSGAKRRLVALLDLRIKATRSEAELRTVSECIGRTAFSLAAAFEEKPGSAPARVFYPIGLFEW